MNFRSRSSYRPITIFALSLVLTLAVGLFAHMPSTLAAAKSAAFLNGNIPSYPVLGTGNASGRVVFWENNCTTNLNASRATGGTPRTVVNRAAYSDNVWLSQSGDPNNNSSTTVPAGTTSINMQVNELLFLCAIVTLPASQTDVPSAANQVTAVNYPNDRGPVPDIAGAPYDPDQASRYEHVSQIQSATVILGGGSIAPGTAGKLLQYTRDLSSRYWPANAVPFVYDTASPLAPGPHNITVRVFYKYINTYHNYAGQSGALSLCTPNGGGNSIPRNPPFNFTPCAQVFSDYTFSFTVLPAPPVCAGGASQAEPLLQPGETSPVSITFPISPSVTIDSVVDSAGNPANIGIAPGTTINFASPQASYTFTATGPAGSAQAYTIKWHVPPNVASGQCSGGVSVVALPYFKAYGQSVLTGGEFKSLGSCNGGGELAGWFNNQSAANGYGASAQLSALALVRIVGFASAQTVASRSPTALTFANTVNIGGPNAHSPDLGGLFDNNPGNYSHCLTEPSPKLPTTNIPTLITVDSTWDGSYANTNGKSLTIQSGSIGLGKNVSLFVGDADVYINGNITYTPGGWALKKIPSFVLVTTGNIYISPNVTELDGLFVARNVGAVGDAGQIFTCANQTAGVDTPVSDVNLYTDCNKQLTVYGTFVADQINLMRTYGTLRDEATGPSVACLNNGGRSSTRTTCAAEVFDFSPEMYLSNPAVYQPANGATQYDTINSLPPVL